jgi:DNA-directed RNA polymerase
MQNTAFRINKDVFRNMREAWAAGQPVFGLETQTFQQLLPRLPDDADPDEITDRKRERSGTFNLNNRIKGLQKVMAFRLSLAERLLDEPRFYFPFQLDHRGRAYPVPQLVNPQSDDIGRCLLEFADGKPLGERGAYWLAIHIANCYWKKNKVSFDQRLEWVHEHEAEIIAFAENPLGTHRFWSESAKPWSFLAACQEWKRFKEQGPDLRSHLPVSMDGSCNGYQHLSAMSRDPIGGRATNLVPADHPQDIYQEVADPVSLQIQFDAEYAGGEARGRQAEASRREARGRQAEASRDEASRDDDRAAALELLGKIDRSVVKPATMTTPYGVTRLRIYKQLLEVPPVKDCKEPKKCAQYLARVLEECIAEVAVEAGNIMEWLRDIARDLARANRGMVWTTPAGFRVVHENREPKTPRVTTADRTLVVYQQDEEGKIALRKQVDGVVAHLIHSLDAAHMMLTVHRLQGEGIHHFAMVHDSFGVHATDIDHLNRVLREEFVRIYSEPVMQNYFKEVWKANPGIHLAALPCPGNLDIRQVLSSEYFFA